jgi:hypothetical protein
MPELELRRSRAADPDVWPAAPPSDAAAAGETSSAPPGDESRDAIR